MIRRSYATTLLVAGLALFPACATPRSDATDGSGTKGGEVSVESLFNNGQCGGTSVEASLTRLDAAALTAFGRRLEAVGVNFDPGEFDIQRETLLLVEMGQKPTAGYGLELADAPSNREGSVVEIPLRWSEPSPGMVSAQVITSPCMLLRVAAGDARSVRVLDEQGKPLLDSPLD